MKIGVPFCIIKDIHICSAQIFNRKNSTIENRRSLYVRLWRFTPFFTIFVELTGVCTDICVISNAMTIKAVNPEVEISVDAKCCAGVTPESHRTALNAMKACQISVED